MTLQDLGYTSDLEGFRSKQGLTQWEVGRVSLEHKDRYIIKSPDQEYEAELIGSLRYASESRYDLPAVGDWVAFSSYDKEKAIIHAIFPRKSIIERKATKKDGSVQIISSNIDYGVIVQSVNRDFNLNRLERYLTICHSAAVKPIVVLSKIDLVSAEETDRIKKAVLDRTKVDKIITTSSLPGGYGGFDSILQKGVTYCLLGSSGVGKSTLLNYLSGYQIMKTGTISTSVNKGRHVTSHRELVVLDRGGIIIDNPGLREVGITDTSIGLENTFDQIIALAKECRFKDCTHISEYDCAVQEAIEQGILSMASFTNFQKLSKEKMHFESSVADRRKKDKSLAKLYKRIQGERRKNKY